MLDQKTLHEIFEYRDGKLYWRHRGQEKVGTVSKSLTGRSYIIVQYQGKRMRCDRIIFKMFHGYLPKQIEFIDKDYSNLKIENLRAKINYTEERKGKLDNNKSGYKGVSLASGKYMAVITRNYKRKYLGVFKTAKEAYKVYCKAACELHGETA